MSDYRPTPGVVNRGCGCLCESPTQFNPGSTASIKTCLNGSMDTNHRSVKIKGTPALLRMGRMHRFLSGMGDDALPIETVGMDLGTISEPVSYLPQLENSTAFFSIPDFTPTIPIETSGMNLGPLQVSSPSAVAQIPNAPSSSTPGGIATASINAASQLLKAKQGSPTATLTPAQIAALQSKAAASPSASSIFGNVPSSDLLMIGAGVALFAVLVNMKK